MRRSSQVAAPLLAAAAMAMLSGCHKTEMQRCVDENNKVVDESFCKQPGQQQLQQRSDGHGGFIFVPLIYHYYYGDMAASRPAASSVEERSLLRRADPILPQRRAAASVGRSPAARAATGQDRVSR